MLRTVADTPSAATESPSIEPAPAGPPSTEPPSTKSGAEAAKPPAAEDVQAADEEFDADRTVLVIRPKGGLRLAVPDAPAAKPSAPVAGGDTVAFIPAATVGGPPVSARPGRQGGPEPGRPGSGQRSPS